MSIIVDIDAHFEPGSEWLNEFPDLAKRLPILNDGELLVKSAFGDFVSSIPESRRPPMVDLTPPGLADLYAQEKSGEQKRRLEFEMQSQRGRADAPARVKWLDSQGIAVQNVICLAAMNYLNSIDDVGLKQDLVEAMNQWLAQTCIDGGIGRLLPVTNLDYSDLNWAANEISRMRKLGSRVVLVPGAPVNDMSPAHPEWDILWNAITENGMLAMFHVGFGRVQFESGWSNMGGDLNDLRRFGMNFHHFEPQLLLSALTFGGVFERHPNLTVVTAEVGVGWMPTLINQIDDRVTKRAQKYVGTYSLPLKPSEYLKQNVRCTPLSWGVDQPLDVIMAQLPDDMMVFSSDFPHFEGFNDPSAYYDTFLSSLTESHRNLFLGDSLLNAYARMGHPLLEAERAALQMHR